MNRLLYQGIACMSLLAASAAQAQSEKDSQYRTDPV